MDMMSFIMSLSSASNTVEAPGPAPTDLVLGESVVTFTGAQTIVAEGWGGHFLYTPRVWWHEGKTYSIYKSQHTLVNGYGQGYILVYDENNGVHKPYRVGNTETLHPVFGVPDSHTVPSFIVDNSGNLFMFQERTHDTPIDIYKGSSFNNFNLLAEKINPGTGATAESGYHNFVKLPDGNGWSWTRMTKLFEAYSGGHGASVEASNGFETWGSLVRNTTNPRPMTSSPGSGTDRTRHYPILPLYRQIVGNYIYLIRVQRVDDYVTGLGLWHKYYVMRTPVGTGRGVVFENLIGTPYSQDVSAANYMDETDLDTNYLFYNSGAEANNSFTPVSTVSLDPKIFIVTGQTNTGNLLLHIIDVLARTQVTKAINITGYHVYPQTSQRMAVEHIAFIEDGQYLEMSIEIDYPASVIKTHIFHSHDMGDSWIDEGDVMPEIATTAIRIAFPWNYHDIPLDRNFMITCYGPDLVTANTAVTYAKRAAKGTLQSETPTIVVPPANLSDANDFFNYVATDGQIVRSGNNVTQLTDQFGLRHATGVNNPQWDGVDTITLTHTSNHHFSIATTGFSGLTKCTFFALVKRTVSTGAGDYGVLFMSNNAVTSSYVGWFANDGGAGDTPSLRFLDAGVTLTDHGQYVPALDEWVLLSWVSDGRCKTDIYVNGMKQYYQETNYSTLTHYQKRGRLDYGTINSVKIGFLDRSASDVYFPFAFKRLVMKNTVYDFETYRALEKKIADLHGITLNYGYQ